MHNRQERRETTKRKWISKIKKLWESGFLFDRVNRVKEHKKNYREWNKAETWQDMTQDKFGVMCKNTGTIYSDKKYDITEEHKMRVRDRSLLPEDEDELNEYLNNKNDKNDKT